jgi:hypothetical protein
MVRTKKPERIYLQWDPEGPANADISWCDEKINDDDLEFYRADVVRVMEETASKQGYRLGFAAAGEAIVKEQAKLLRPAL